MMTKVDNINKYLRKIFVPKGNAKSQPDIQAGDQKSS